MKKHNKKAFTLVELLVVIAIIAILAVVSVVGYTAFTKKARDSVAQQELKQVVDLLIADDIGNDAFEITTSGLVLASDASDTSTYDIKTELLTSYTADLSGIKGTIKATFNADKKTIESLTYTLNDGGEATYSFVAA